MRPSPPWLLIVFLVGCRPTVTVSAVSLGCFRDQGAQGRPNPTGTTGRDVDGLLVTETNMTTERCVEACSSTGFSVAATQWRVQCFCGNSYGKSGPAANCNQPCAGNPHEICGGDYASSVYRVR